MALQYARYRGAAVGIVLMALVAILVLLLTGLGNLLCGCERSWIVGLWSGVGRRGKCQSLLFLLLCPPEQHTLPVDDQEDGKPRASDSVRDSTDGWSSLDEEEEQEEQSATIFQRHEPAVPFAAQLG